MASDTGDHPERIALRHLESGDRPGRIEQLEPGKTSTATRCGMAEKVVNATLQPSR
jgi:hypothetical protein